ncbi:MAG: GatB/YqeY domain-containing protein [Patescibacteria group bacterium]
MTAAALFTQINTDLKQAMKQSQAEATNTLRMLVSAVRNEQIAKQKDLSDEDVVAVVSREVKKRRDSVTQYTAAGRADLADKEKAEISILQKYLPEQLSEDQIREQVKMVIGENAGAPFGKVMGAAMAKLKGQADGNVVQRLVKEQLG